MLRLTLLGFEVAFSVPLRWIAGELRSGHAVVVGGLSAWSSVLLHGQDAASDSWDVRLDAGLLARQAEVVLVITRGVVEVLVLSDGVRPAALEFILPLLDGSLGHELVTDVPGRVSQLMFSLREEELVTMSEILTGQVAGGLAAVVDFLFQLGGRARGGVDVETVAHST